MKASCTVNKKAFHPNGALYTSIFYDNAQLHGIKAMWDKDGSLLEEANYEKGKT